MDIGPVTSLIAFVAEFVVFVFLAVWTICQRRAYKRAFRSSMGMTVLLVLALVALSFPGIWLIEEPGLFSQVDLTVLALTLGAPLMPGLLWVLSREKRGDGK
jgi:cation transport ATPase